MRKNRLLLLAGVLLLAATASAQDQEPSKAVMPMTPPGPLTDDLMQWMVGEWEGWSSTPVGKSQDWQKIEWALDNQFLLIHFTGKTTEVDQQARQAMAEAMKLSKADMDKMQNMVYKGMGTITLNRMTGEVIASWFDNLRGVYTATGRREGNKLITIWPSPMGPETRTFEKISDDKMVTTFKGKDFTGKDAEARGEYTRTKSALKN